MNLKRMYTVSEIGESGSQHRHSGLLDDVELDDCEDEEEEDDRLDADVDDSELDEEDEWLDVDVLEAEDGDCSLMEDDVDGLDGDDSSGSCSWHLTWIVTFFIESGYAPAGAPGVSQKQGIRSLEKESKNEPVHGQ